MALIDVTYTGLTKLREFWGKTKSNFTNINTQITNHVAGTADKHAAEHITYTGNENGATVKAAIDNVHTRVDTIVAGAGTSNTEILDARGTYPILKDRLDGTDTHLADIVTLNPNGINDTANILNELANKGICNLGLGTFICTELVVTGNQHIYGQGIGRTIIKLKDTTNTNLIKISNGFQSSITNLTLDGNKANNTTVVTEGFEMWNSINVLLVEVLEGYAYSSVGMILEKLMIKNGSNNGLHLSSRNNNWVYNINSIQIFDCDGYGFKDNSSDNTFSNFYISACKLADMYAHASANKYVNFKCDNGGFISTDLLAYPIDGANIVLNNSAHCQFSNLDSQSAYYVGIKMESCADIRIDIILDSNGMAYNIGDINGLGTGMIITNSHDITGTLIFTNYINRQNTDLKIDVKSYNISFNSTTINSSKIINLGNRCSITNLDNFDNLFKGFLSAYSLGTAQTTGFINAYNIDLVPSNLKLWFDGIDFLNSPPTATLADRSGNSNVGTATNFGYTSTSGSNGSGGIVIDGTNDILNIPNMFPSVPPLGFTIMFKWKLFSSVAYSNKFTIGAAPNFFCIGTGAVTELNVMMKVTSGGNAYAGAVNSMLAYTLPDNTICTMTVTITSDVMKVYKNGVLQNSMTGLYDLSKLNNIGGNSTVFNYELYNLIVYNRALTSNEIMQNYNAIK